MLLIVSSNHKFYICERAAHHHHPHSIFIMSQILIHFASSKTIYGVWKLYYISPFLSKLFNSIFLNLIQ